MHRFGRQVVPLVPVTGTKMQDGWQRRLYLLQVAAQHLGKQVVVAVPVPLVVQRDHKQVRPLERFQHRLAPLLLCHRIAEWLAEAVQDRGVQEKLLQRRGLPCEHLVAQIVEHIAMAAGEGSEKPGDIGSAPEGERSQLQASNPAFRAMLEGGDGLGRKVESHHGLQKRARFGGAKA